MIIQVPHTVGPFYVKTKGEEVGTFVRLGSTNRLADTGMIENIKRLKQHLYYDEIPCIEAAEKDIDFILAEKLFSKESKKFSTQTAKSLQLIVKQQEKFYPSIGGVLLFGKDKKKSTLFPHTTIRCARFLGKQRPKIHDPIDIPIQLPLAVDAILEYIKNHAISSYEIDGAKGRLKPPFPPIVVREAIINSLVHTDYSVKGASIQLPCLMIG